MTVAKKIFVISDLHLGGEPPSATSRGFRMMKHPDKLASFLRLLAREAGPGCEVELVINGDFVDFLADESAGDDCWTAFKYEPGSALRAFEAIAGGLDACVFDALAELVKTCRLTVMLGNHDLELSLPEVRAAFLRRLGEPAAGRVRFLEDGEALIVGDSIIEHGNAHDPTNAVDFPGLKALRDLRASGRYELEAQREIFRPPAGSELVVTVMNPLKERYAFVDLLKPGSEALFTLLFALEPEAKGELGRLARLARTMGRELVAKLGLESDSAPMSSSAEPDEDEMSALAEYVRASVPPELAHPEPPPSSDSPISWLKSKLGLAQLAATGARESLRLLLPELRRAFSALETEPTWRTDVEAGQRYQKAAEAHAAGAEGKPGYRFVVFGHTHHAKRVELGATGAVYLNSGTWANLMQFPRLPEDDDQALDALWKFAEDCRDNNFATSDRLLADPEVTEGGRVRQVFNPTYVRLDVDGDGRVKNGVLGVFDWTRERLDA